MAPAVLPPTPKADTAWTPMRPSRACRRRRLCRGPAARRQRPVAAVAARRPPLVTGPDPLRPRTVRRRKGGAGDTPHPLPQFADPRPTGGRYRIWPVNSSRRAESTTTALPLTGSVDGYLPAANEIGTPSVTGLLSDRAEGLRMPTMHKEKEGRMGRPKAPNLSGRRAN